MRRGASCSGAWAASPRRARPTAAPCPWSTTTRSAGCSSGASGSCRADLRLEHEVERIRVVGAGAGSPALGGVGVGGSGLADDLVVDAALVVRTGQAHRLGREREVEQ